MKQLTYILALLLGSLGVMGQTNQPLPAGSVPLTATTYLYPADSTVWLYNEFDNLAIKVGTWQKVDSLFRLGWTPAQVDSAITANVADYIPLSQKGSPNGVATIDGSGKVPLTQIPEALLGAVNYQGSYNAATNTPALPSSPGSGTKGHYYVVSTAGTQFGNNYSEGDWIISNGVEWQKVDNNNAVTSVNGQVGSVVIDIPVTSVNGETGAVMIDAADVGLGNVDNTSDLNKPISTAQQTALDGKENAFSKNTAFNKNFGTVAGTVAEGNDQRILNGQTAFSWGNPSGRFIEIGNVTGVTGAQLSGSTSIDDLGNVSVYATTTSGAPANGHLLSMRVSSMYGAQVHAQAVGDDVWRFRRRTGAAWQPWVTMWHSGNFTPPVVFTRSVNGLVPSPGSDTGTKRYLDDSGSWTVPSGGGGGTATDLSIQNRTTTTLQIGSSTGSAATVPAATTALSGLMTSGYLQTLNEVYGWGNHAGLYLPLGYNTNTVSKITSSDLNNMTDGVAYAGTSASNKPGGANATILSAQGTSGYSMQFGVIGTSSYGLWYRGQYGGVWGDWREVWHSGNLNPSNYLTTSYVPTWASISGKPSTFTPSPHNHNASDINAGTLAIARIPTGTTGSTVALGNHTHTFSAITSKPTTLSGYGITDAVPSSLTINGKSLTTNVTLTASDVAAVPLSGNATVSGTKTFSSPVIVPNGTASNHAVNLSQITGSGSLILGTEPNKVKTNYQNDTTYVRKSDIIPLTASMSVPGNTIAAESSISQTFGVSGVTANDVVVVNIDGPSMLIGKASAINGGVNVWLVNPTSTPLAGYSTINLKIVVIKYQ